MIENYGVFCDFLEKSVLMCMLYLFLYNIDYCLMWVWSEFEGVFEKVFVEVNFYLFKLEEYVAVALSNFDVFVWENVEKVV